MKNKILIAVITCIVSFSSVFSQGTFKTMFYNLLNFPIQSVPVNRIQNLEIVLNDYQPDLFMVCELNNETGANSILNMMQQGVNPNYAMANFELNTSDDDSGDQNDLQNLIFYDTTKIILDNQTIVPSRFRDFNHYRLKLNTIDQNTNPIYLNVIVCHLKSSSGSTNEAYRLEMAQDLTAYLETLPSNSYVMLGGDLNLYTNSEDAFIELLDTTNNITFIDPANRIGSWHNNTSYLDVFTQSTRTTNGLGGATGGFDDRFDFILTSESMQNNSELQFVTNSYNAYGNNNNINCYNQEINSENCAGVEYSLTIRNALYNFSDHLPVTLQIETDQVFLSIPEYTTLDSFEIIGTNSIQNTLNLRINNQSITSKNLNIYNSLGQLVKIVFLEQTETISVNISNLSSGIYYITVPSMNVEPLKFVKVN